MHSSRHPRRTRGPAPFGRLILGLGGFLATSLLLSPMTAFAQSSTPVYGSDTAYVAYDSPSLRTFNNAQYNSSSELVLGQQGQYQTTYGGAYDPDPVDVSQGFVSRLDVSSNGSNGFIFVVKNPSATDYTETPPYPPTGGIYGLGAYGLSSSLGVAFINYAQSAANHSDRHVKEVEVFADDASGNATVLADVQGLDIDYRPAGTVNVLQVRYLPRFATLDVYVGPRLITRVAGVDLAKLGVAPSGQAELGVTSGVPADDYANNVDYFPAYLNHFSIGDQLVFGSGFGPNFYEDRFPFLTTGQSVWGTNVSSYEYAPSLEQKGSAGPKGFSTGYSPHGVPVFSLDASGSASYDVGLGLDATATGGTADISYPLFLDMVFPTQYSVKSGDTFALPMTFYPDLAASLRTTSPSANVTANLTCITDVTANLDASVFGQSIASGQLFHAKTNVDHVKFFDAQEILTSGLIPNVNGGVNYAGSVQGNEGATGKKNATHDGTPGEGSTKGGGKAGTLSKYVSVGITVPDLSTSGTVTGFGATGSHLTSSASSPFVTLSSDFTNSILAEIPGLDVLTALPFFNNDYSLDLGGQSVELGFHIADIYGDVNVGAAVSYDFTPQPQVTLTLTDPAYSGSTFTYPYVLGPYPLDPSTNKVRNPPALTMPDDGTPLTVTPTVVITGSTFQPTGQFTFGADLSINPISLSYAFNGTSFSTDPLFGFPLTASFSQPVYTFTPTPFAIGGQSGGAANAVPFQTSLQGKPFTLFPTASPDPVIDSVTPASAPVGSADLPISLATEQASYTGDVVWDYDGVPTDPQTYLANRVFTSNTSITATIPAALLTTQGLHTITLINHNDGDAQLYPSNLYTFTVNAPAPVLTGLNAQTSGGTVAAGGPSFTLGISGSQFSPPVAPINGGAGLPGSVVLWNGKPLQTTYNSAGSLSASVPAGLLKSSGMAAITVYTAGPGGGTSSALTLTISATPVNPTPTLTRLSQTSTAVGHSALSLTLSGAGFVPGATVLLNNGTTTATRTATFVSSSTLGLTLTASDFSKTGAFTIRVQNPAPVAGPSAGLVFTVGAPPAGGGGFTVAPSVTRTSGGYRVTLTVSNTSETTAATSTIISSAFVGGDSTGKGAVYPSQPNPLQPILIGTIPVSSQVTPHQTYTFPTSIGKSGPAVLLTIQGSESGQTFTSRLRVVLP